MRITVCGWQKDGKAQIFDGGSTSEAMDKAENWGAIRIEDCLGGVYRKLQGEMVYIGENKSPRYADGSKVI